jgi:hypothetical protein
LIHLGQSRSCAETAAIRAKTKMRTVWIRMVYWILEMKRIGSEWIDVVDQLKVKMSDRVCVCESGW